MSLNSKVALSTLDELKLFLADKGTDDFMSSDAYDGKLENIINAVGQFFNTYTGRTLVEAAHTDYFDGDGSSTLLLPEFPIISTASTIEVYVDIDREYPASSKIAAAKIILYSKDGVVRIEDDVFTEGPQSVKVVYTAGYELESDDGVVLPEDLRQAALMTCGALWKVEKEKIFKMTAVSISGGSVTFDVEKALLPFAEEVLELYVAQERAGIRW